MLRPLKRVSRSIDRTRKEYPRSIWTMTGGTFIGFGIGPVIAGGLFDVGLGRWIWIGSLILGLIVAMGFRSFGPRLRAREALIEA